MHSPAPPARSQIQHRFLALSRERRVDACPVPAACACREETRCCWTPGSMAMISCGRGSPASYVPLLEEVPGNTARPGAQRARGKQPVPMPLAAARGSFTENIPPPVNGYKDSGGYGVTLGHRSRHSVFDYKSPLFRRNSWVCNAASPAFPL